MRILDLELTHFGKFHNKTVSFHPGLNIIYGKNEAGKTTIHAFIRAMLFGISEEMLERYRPWQMNTGYSGKLRFLKDEVTYRIERDFEENVFCLYDETNDKKVEAPADALAALLAPMDSENFDNILHIGQMQHHFFQKLTAGYQKEKEQLDHTLLETKEALLSQEKELQECKEDVRSVASELKSLEQAKEAHTQKWDALSLSYKKNIDEKEAEIQSIFHELAVESGGKPVRKGSFALSVLFFLFAAICGIFYFYCRELTLVDYIPYVQYGILLFLALAVIVFLIQLVSNHRKKKALALQKEAEAASAELEAMVSNKPLPDVSFHADYLARRKELEGYIIQVKEHMEEVQACMKENMELYHTLQQERKNNRFPELYQQASLFFHTLSEEKYREIQWLEDGSILLTGDSHSIPLLQASRGTADQVYFCLRLAAADLLGKEEHFPILLDDVFAYYDDERLEIILKMLKTRNHQIILFTCHKRESNLLSGK